MSNKFLLLKGNPKLYMQPGGEAKTETELVLLNLAVLDILSLTVIDRTEEARKYGKSFFNVPLTTKISYTFKNNPGQLLDIEVLDTTQEILAAIESLTKDDDEDC